MISIVQELRNKIDLIKKLAHQLNNSGSSKFSYIYFLVFSNFLFLSANYLRSFFFSRKYLTRFLIPCRSNKLMGQSKNNMTNQTRLRSTAGCHIIAFSCSGNLMALNSIAEQYLLIFL